MLLSLNFLMHLHSLSSPFVLNLLPRKLWGTLKHRRRKNRVRQDRADMRSAPPMLQSREQVYCRIWERLETNFS